jgi:glycosyltransferase involved in cell wall biosynthesis
VLPQADDIAVICFDVPFLGLPPLLPERVRKRFALVPRSTGLLHDPTGTDRVAFEREGLEYLAAHGGRIAAISDYMRDHLVGDYGVAHDSLIPLADGLAPDEWQPRAAEPGFLPREAEGGFVFALGRATPYKGWDDLVDALALLQQRGVSAPHAVLAAVTDQPAATDYQLRLASRIVELELDSTLLTRFDAANRDLLTHPALRAAVVPSRTEPFGRIPLEAYAAGATPVVATTAGGLAEQVIDGVTGFAAEPGNPAALADALERALALGPAERDRMRIAGHEFARSRFDHERAVRQFLGQFAPWAMRPGA